MVTRVALLILAGALPGCAFPYLPTCSGQVSVPESRSKRCMTSAEYETARKSVAHSVGNAPSRKGDTADEIAEVQVTYPQYGNGVVGAEEER